MSGCPEFRAELARLGSRPAGAPVALDAHWRACAECRALVERDEALVRLLEDGPAPAPRGLSARVLAGVSAARAEDAREARLDALLDLVEAPELPPELARRVLLALAPARRRRALRRPVLVAAAAVLVAALGFFAWRVRTGTPGAPALVEREPELRELEGDEELVAYALERWDLLTEDDVDLWFASLDPVDEVLLEYAGPEALRDFDPDTKREEGGR